MHVSETRLFPILRPLLPHYIKLSKNSYKNHLGGVHTVPDSETECCRTCYKASVHTRNVAFEAVSAPEQYCSTPLLKVERSVSDRFLKWSKSSLNTFIGAEIAMEPVLVNDLFKSKGSVTSCITDRASVHTGNASEPFLHRNGTLILVHTVLEQLSKQSKNLSIQLNIALYDCIKSKSELDIGF